MLTVWGDQVDQITQHWCHPARSCRIAARLRGYAMTKVYRNLTRRQWQDKLSRCAGCDQWINWHDEEAT